MSAPVWLVGAGGRTPFVGHFRGARIFGGVRLAWAGRVAGSAGVVEGWEAAEAARDALGEVSGSGSPSALLAAACGALGRIDARWLGRGDMSVLLVATEAGRSWAAGAGLGGVWAPAEGGWRALVEAPHPLLGEPGVPDARAAELPTVDRWVATPTGVKLPTGDVAAACGART